MSRYYQINGLKVRVSDHEPNEGLRGSSDIYLYTISADNRLLSIEAQIEFICEKKGYNLSDFQEVINDWKDGSYDKHTMEYTTEESDEDNYISDISKVLRAAISDSNDLKLAGHTLSKSARHSEIKALSELTGVSQSYIKKHFGIK